MHDLLTGFPVDPGVTHDPGRTHIVSETLEPNAARLSVLNLAHWKIGDPETGSPKEGPVPAFRLVQVAGEGGFGEVWEAVQTSLGRRVALKRLSRKRSHDSAGLSAPSVSLGLFQQEALITARIEHPNIPPVYDLGLDDEGRPVLAMRYLQGTPWPESIRPDFQSLSPADFLAKHLPVLVDVLQAVAYAHSRGVVHRDLKPGQVMVGEFGETWVIDWGLAIRFGDRAPSDPVEREAWLALPAPKTALNPAGTLAFMAPEQTQFTADGIGPWTDIYMLGGILFFLLTGSPPHPASESPEAFQQAAAAFVPQMAEIAPDRDIPGSLRDLCLRCLSRDRALRPASVSELLAAVQDFISGTSRRHESVSVVSRLVPLLASAQGNYSAYTEVLSELSRARALWSENPAVSELEETTILAFSREAVRNGDLVLARVYGERLTDAGVRGTLLDDIEREDQRERRERRERRLLLVTAAVLAVALAFGTVFYTRALAKERDRAESARKQEAAARARSDSLLEFMLKDLRDSLEPVGRLDVLDKVLRRALEEVSAQPETALSEQQLFLKARALDELGHVAASRGDLEKAEETYKKSLVIKQRLLAKSPGVASWRRSEASSLQSLGSIDQVRGDLDKAGKKFASALEIRSSLAPPEEDESDARTEKANLLQRIADLQEAKGELEKAFGSNQAALALFDEALRHEPQNLNWRRDRAVLGSRLGDILSAQGKNEEALKHYERYRDGMKVLVQKDSQDAPLLRELAVAHNSVGWALRGLGRYDEALVEIRAQQLLAAKLAATDSANVLWKRDLAQSHAAAGRILKAAGRPKEALEEYRVANAGMADVARIDAGDKGGQRDAALSVALTASVLLQLKRWPEARDLLTPAVATLEVLVKEDPKNVGWQHGLASAEVWLGEALSRTGNAASGRRFFERAASRLAPLTKGPGALDQKLGSVRASALLWLDRPQEAKPLVDALLASGWQDPEFLELVKRKSRLK